MFIRAKSVLTVIVLAVAISVSCGKKEAESTPAAESAPAAPPAPAPPAPGISQGLAHNSAAPFYVFDALGPVNYPAIQKDIQISGDTEIAVTGWALDVSKKGPAEAVDVVLDGVPYAAHYGIERTDVSSHFQRPDYTHCGYQLVLARGRFNKGKHAVAVRVIAGDKKSYTEGPTVSFTVN